MESKFTNSDRIGNLALKIFHNYNSSSKELKKLPSDVSFFFPPPPNSTKVIPPHPSGRGGEILKNKHPCVTYDCDALFLLGVCSI